MAVFVAVTGSADTRAEAPALDSLKRQKLEALELKGTLRLEGGNRFGVAASVNSRRALLP
jgi:hypothetical protein